MIDSDRSLDFRNYPLFRSFQRNLDLISQCGATDYKFVYNPHRPITVTSSIYHKPKSCSSYIGFSHQQKTHHWKVQDPKMEVLYHII